MSTGTGVCIITIMEESVHTFQTFKKINLGSNNKKVLHIKCQSAGVVLNSWRSYSVLFGCSVCGCSFCDGLLALCKITDVTSDDFSVETSHFLLAGTNESLIISHYFHFPFSLYRKNLWRWKISTFTSHLLRFWGDYFQACYAYLYNSF